MTLKSRYCRRLVVAAGLGACLAAAGCASGPREGGAAALERGAPAPSDCFFNRGIRDYTALDERNLIIHGAGSRAYHLVLATPSFNLDSEWSIGLLDGGGVGGDGRICPFGGDRVIIDGAFVESVSIRSIEAIDAAGVEDLKIRFGREEAAPEELVTVTDVEVDEDSDEADDEADD